MQSPNPASPLSTLFTPVIAGSLAATWFVWGSTYLAIKFALEDLAPFWQMGTRFLVAGAVLAMWMRWRGSPWPSARQWRHALVVGGMMLGGGMGMVAVAEQTVASGLIVAFIGAGPMTTALMNLSFGVKPSRLEWAGIVVGLVGVVMLAGGAGFGASTHGLLAIITAIVCWSLGTVLSTRVTPLAPGAMGFASEMLAGGALLLLMSVVTGEPMNTTPTMKATLAWAYLVVFGSLIAFNAYMVLLARTSTTLAMSYCFVNPVIAMLLGVALGGETVTPREWLATAVIVAGVVLVVISQGRRSRA